MASNHRLTSVPALLMGCQGFVNVAIPPQDKFVAVLFDAMPSTANMDAVMEVSPAAAGSFNDIAAAVRFNPDGKIDARDGDVYRR